MSANKNKDIRFNIARVTTQKMKFSIKDFFSECDQIRRKLRIWSHLLKKSFMANFIFCAVNKSTKMFPGDSKYIHILKILKFTKSH